MATFPKSESEVLALAQDIAGDLANHPNLFPAPPVAPDGLRKLIVDYTRSRDEWTVAQARAVEATAAKQARLSALTDAMQSNLRYAENTVEDPTQSSETTLFVLP
jgi:hypothetical protein